MIPVIDRTRRTSGRRSSEFPPIRPSPRFTTSTRASDAPRVDEGKIAQGETEGLPDVQQAIKGAAERFNGDDVQAPACVDRDAILAIAHIKIERNDLLLASS